MVDILLLSPPSRMDNHYRPPFSLLYVAGHYKKLGLSVKISDYPLPEQIRNRKFWKGRDYMISECKAKMLYDIAVYDPKYIGISCYSTEYQEVKELIKEIKEITFSKIIGGREGFRQGFDRVEKGDYDRTD